MSCCRPGDEDRKRSKNLDKQIRQERRKFDEELKLLLLGAGESGKSTFAKQMKILHMNGYDENERVAFRMIIRRNIIDSVQTILRACKDLRINLLPENEEIIPRFFELEGAFDSMMVEDIKVLWKDPGFQEAVSRSSEFQYFDSTPYFISHLDRIGSLTYNPTDLDILYSRSKTGGIIETFFTVNGIHFKMCDVAGQRSERRKWMQCFGDVKAVIVIVGISEYDQVLREQAEVNRMHEALKLFGDICNSRWFEKTTMILFLNKIDLFAAKIERVPLNTCFPNYTGPNTFEDCTRYIAELFRSVNRNPNKLIYTHLTCATDTSNISLIFEDVKNAILQDRLADF